MTRYRLINVPLIVQMQYRFGWPKAATVTFKFWLWKYMWSNMTIVAKLDTSIYGCVSYRINSALRSNKGILGCRIWYHYWGHCSLMNNLRSSPHTEGEARGLCWVAQVVNETTMSEIKASISTLSWWKNNDEQTNTVKVNVQNDPQNCPCYSIVTCAHLGVMWPDCFPLVTRLAFTVISW